MGSCASAIPHGKKPHNKNKQNTPIKDNKSKHKNHKPPTHTKHRHYNT